mmetsp:Transcript_81247/g.217175  ORF Transcript_81247/g.217175 Transcript_81247/m.217175 type:complete len:335 (-) Transcript_81247:1872-2876(-)
MRRCRCSAPGEAWWPAAGYWLCGGRRSSCRRRGADCACGGGWTWNTEQQPEFKPLCANELRACWWTSDARRQEGSWPGFTRCGFMPGSRWCWKVRRCWHHGGRPRPKSSVTSASWRPWPQFVSPGAGSRPVARTRPGRRQHSSCSGSGAASSTVYMSPRRCLLPFASRSMLAAGYWWRCWQGSSLPRCTCRPSGVASPPASSTARCKSCRPAWAGSSVAAAAAPSAWPCTHPPPVSPPSPCATSATSASTSGRWPRRRSPRLSEPMWPPGAWCSSCSGGRCRSRASSGSAGPWPRWRGCGTGRSWTRPGAGGSGRCDRRGCGTWRPRRSRLSCA